MDSLVLNRTFANAEALAARFAAHPHRLDELESLLPAVDIVLTCIGGKQPILNYGMLKAALAVRRNRPIFLIDIGVPRNVDPRVEKLDNAYVYDMDDLQSVADANAGARRRESDRAEVIVAQEKLQFDAWLSGLRAVPTIRHLRARVERIRRNELQRVAARLELDESQREGVEQLTRAIVNKVLHAPLAYLRNEVEDEAGSASIETARALAEFLCEDEAAMVRLDMSEYMEKHAVSRMLGAPPGYIGHEEGGALTEAVRRKPHSVLLFDEIEKAHPDVLHTLLQLFDDGRLTDGQGHVVDFSQTLVLMTSNLRDDEQLRAHFRPELLNRLDEILRYEPLREEHVRRIVDVQVARIAAQLAEQEIALELSEAAHAQIAAEGWDPEYGARPLKRALQRSVQNVLARAILADELGAGDTARIDWSAGSGWHLERRRAA